MHSYSPRTRSAYLRRRTISRSTHATFSTKSPWPRSCSSPFAFYSNALIEYPNLCYKFLLFPSQINVRMNEQEPVVIDEDSRVLRDRGPATGRSLVQHRFGGKWQTLMLSQLTTSPFPTYEPAHYPPIDQTLLIVQICNPISRIS